MGTKSSPDDFSQITPTTSPRQVLPYIYHPETNTPQTISTLENLELLERTRFSWDIVRVRIVTEELSTNREKQTASLKCRVIPRMKYDLKGFKQFSFRADPVTPSVDH